MDEAALRTELQALQKGRGVNRPGVGRWLGDNLKRLITWDSSVTDAEAQSRLVTLLRDLARLLPPDLALVFLAATGVDSTGRLLKDRLAEVVRALEREPRTLTRRLRHAEQLIAAQAALRNPGPRSPYASRGWQWAEFDVSVSLAAPEPRISSRRLLTATVEGLTQVEEVFVMPSGFNAPGIVADFGCEVGAIAHPTQTSWIANLVLPHPLARGASHAMGVSVTLPSRSAMQPFVVMAPIRPCQRYSVEVDFGSPSAASTAWTIDGIPSTVVHEPPEHAERIDPTLERVVSREFDNPQVGLCFGLGWQWAERGAS